MHFVDTGTVPYPPHPRPENAANENSSSLTVTCSCLSGFAHLPIGRRVPPRILAVNPFSRACSALELERAWPRGFSKLSGRSCEPCVLAQRLASDPPRSSTLPISLSLALATTAEEARSRVQIVQVSSKLCVTIRLPRVYRAYQFTKMFSKHAVLACVRAIQIFHCPTLPRIMAFDSPTVLYVELTVVVAGREDVHGRKRAYFLPS